AGPLQRHPPTGANTYCHSGASRSLCIAAIFAGDVLGHTVLNKRKLFYVALIQSLFGASTRESLTESDGVIFVLFTKVVENNTFDGTFTARIAKVLEGRK